MKLYTDKQWLIDTYISKGLGIERIAKLCGVSPRLIHRYLVRFDIPRRKVGGRGGEFASAWKGGKTRSTNGYIWIHVDKPHLKQISKRHHYVPEQILVAEKTLGRLLRKEEIIHHINEIKDDNRPENLFLFSNTQEHSRYHQKLRKGTIDTITLSNLF